MSKDIFCVKPFQLIDIKKNAAGLCCWIDMQVWEGASEDMNVADAWNSANAQKIRASIHDGTFKYCKSNCPFLGDPERDIPDSDGGQSDCKEFLEVISNPVVKKNSIKDLVLKKVIDEQLIHLPYLPPVVECGFDLSCNLSCPTCRTNKIIETDRKSEILYVQQKLEEQVFSEVKTLYITGSGDPFGSPFFNSWLRNLDKSSLPNLKNIHLHTNAQLWTSKMWEKIPEDIRKYCKTAEISIDAASEDTYAMNRPGGSFSRLLENLQFIASLRKNGPLEYLKVHMVVQQNNFHEMLEFVELGKRYSADCVYFSRVTDWGTFSQAELQSRQVHLADNVRHEEFVRVVNMDALKDPIVDLGNLKFCLNQYE